ncbi:glycosyltransferase family 4 protein [Thetidibacter halocola]|uniref:Glycosyltransferase family 4 protein n=1 Tax=Thetidibacter halocola TaxID=2827239 RepID=A0A8J8B7M4_9RHOB|nr:glycosyltransferase family 4 protein [Thetidibacter halocola]MBS0123859.1 glycosyltransferase family 4 protein [Thetidibacter halocola]
MARLLFILPRFHTNMWFAVRQMLRDGHEVKFLVNFSARGEDHSLAEPVVMGRYPSRAEVEAAVREFDPDLVIIRNAWAISRRAARVARRMGRPAVLYNQIPLSQRTSLVRRVELWWKGLPARRITPVRGLGPVVRPDPLATYLPWPVAPLPVTAVRPAGQDRLRVLLVGKLGMERKNQTALIDALARSDLAGRIDLTLVGALPDAGNRHYEDLRRLADKPWVTLAGEVPFHAMPDLYATHDVCILPSFAEPLGTSPVEAMAYGTVPMISTQCGSAGYLIDGQDGLLFDPSDLAGAVDALRRLAEDRDGLARLKSGALATVRRDLSEAVFAQKMADLLRDLRVA